MSTSKGPKKMLSIAILRFCSRTDYHEIQSHLSGMAKNWTSIAETAVQELKQAVMNALQSDGKSLCIHSLRRLVRRKVQFHLFAIFFSDVQRRWAVREMEMCAVYYCINLIGGLEGDFFAR